MYFVHILHSKSRVKSTAVKWCLRIDVHTTQTMFHVPTVKFPGNHVVIMPLWPFPGGYNFRKQKFTIWVLCYISANEKRDLLYSSLSETPTSWLGHNTKREAQYFAISFIIMAFWNLKSLSLVIRLKPESSCFQRWTLSWPSIRNCICCLSVVWSLEWTTCLLRVGTRFWKLNWKTQLVCKFDIAENGFHYFLLLFIHIYI